jgi:DtxR family Mn-dependent transcriptional regulator
LAERLSVSAPAVTEMVVKLEKDKLLDSPDGRVLVMSDTGRAVAQAVMRKHRLAECLLFDVIGLSWLRIHHEACKWEHFISDEVEERLVEVLGHPVECPHGNLIPGMASEAGADLGDSARVLSLRALAGRSESAVVQVRRISEWVQVHDDAMDEVQELGLMPGRIVELELAQGAPAVMVAGASRKLDPLVADHVYAQPASA